MQYEWLKNKIGRRVGHIEELEPGARATEKWLASGWIKATKRKSKPESPSPPKPLSTRSMAGPPEDKAVKGKDSSNK